MSQYKEIPYFFQFAKFQILTVHLHVELFWSRGIPTLDYMGSSTRLGYPMLSLIF